MSRHDLTDRQWQVLEPLLPSPKNGPGRPRIDNRKCLNGILYVLKTGIPWADLPAEYGSPSTCWRRFDEWSEAGVRDRIWRALLSTLDQAGKIEWAAAFLDGSFVPSKKGATPVGRTKIGKGSKVMLIARRQRLADRSALRWRATARSHLGEPDFGHRRDQKAKTRAAANQNAGTRRRQRI
jgi:transposase